MSSKKPKRAAFVDSSNEEELSSGSDSSSSDVPPLADASGSSNEKPDARPAPPRPRAHLMRKAESRNSKKSRR
eukprot:4087201-Pleurochrysis_carterae.AAC.1